MFPGEVQGISGRLPMSIPAVGDLACSSDSPYVRIEFLDARGTTWRGRLHTAPAIPEGESRFRVHLKWEKPDERFPAYTLFVFHNTSDYRATLTSLFQRFLGISPWWITLASFPLLLLSLFLSYQTSMRMEARMNAEGLASVFKVNRRKEGSEISFGFGAEDGIQPGETLWLLDSDLEPIGETIVRHVGRRYSTAEVAPDLPVKPDYLVSRKRR